MRITLVITISSLLVVSVCGAVSAQEQTKLAHPTGDLTCDNVIDLKDVVILGNFLDGHIDLTDICGAAEADFDRDGDIDEEDYVLLYDHVAYILKPKDPPETSVDLDTIEVIQPTFSSPRVERFRKYFSLPGPTSTYPGITITWSASDSLDSAEELHAFDFNWILFGPYSTYEEALPDSTRIARTNDDLATGELEWTDSVSHTFVNLRSGWHVFWVRSRDNAFGEDPTPAMVRFQVVEPSFHKPFLLMDATNWKNGRLLNAGSIFFREQSDDSLTLDTIRTMYEDLFEDHGYVFDRASDTWYRQMSAPPDAYRALPDRDVLGSYRALIVYDEDMQVALDFDNRIGEFASRLGEYMDVGGRVVLIGRNLFGPDVTGWSATDLAQNAELTEDDFGNKYFAVTHMYFPGSLGEALVGPPDTALDISDFEGTFVLDPDFPAVSTDTIRTLYLSQVPVASLIDRNGDVQKNWLWVPDVNTLSIDTDRGATGIYNFNSAMPDSSFSHGRLCGAHYQFYDSVLARYTYRTAIITFPFFPLKQDPNVRALAGELLDLILEDVPTDN